MRTVTVNVTRRDVRFGSPCEGGACPIALAATRAVGVPVDIHSHRAWFDLGNGRTYVWLPEKAVKAYREFDQTQKMQPFAFPLEIPEAA